LKLFHGPLRREAGERKGAIAKQWEGEVVFDTFSVILSEAKDLMPVASGDEVLRFAQDDKKPTSSFAGLRTGALPLPSLRGKRGLKSRCHAPVAFFVGRQSEPQPGRLVREAADVESLATQSIDELLRLRMVGQSEQRRSTA
jgi:hypothetical protein